MPHTYLIRGLLLSVLLIPAMAQAYTSPEEVLNSDENAGFFAPPPRPRDAEAIQARQQASVAARREAEQALLFAQSSSSSSTVSDTSSSSSVPATGQPALSTEEQRILDRVRMQQMQAEIEARAQVLASQQSLHGGAPLSDTGPGTIISAFVLAGAGLWTIWKAKKMEGRSR